MGKGRQKQVSAEVLLDGKSLNDQVVREGLAWWNHKQTRGGRLKMLQAAARAERRGLWTDPDPIPPWDWRKGIRPTRKG
jgi:endonuclease YncB( thermonuclease family)